MSTKFNVSVASGKAAEKPAKPYPEFPLFPHATKRWAKKIRGKLHYFGPWADPHGALERYLDQKDDLHAGRRPRLNGDGVSLRDLSNRYLTHKKHLVDAGDIAPRTWAEYRATCDHVLAAFGKDRLVDDLRSDDFQTLRHQLARRYGPVGLGNEINRVRMLFKFAFDEELIDRPVRYGQSFKRPSKKTLRKNRAEKGPRMFEAVDIHRLLESAGMPLKAMILLAINCGFGNKDCASLPKQVIDFERGWIDFPRPKTGIERRCPLWPETIEAILAAIEQRPKVNDPKHDDLVFITSRGLPWAKDIPDSPVTKETRKLLDRLDMYRPGLGFYALRHTFETIAGESRDQVAVDYIMGHAPSGSDMSAVYRERISDERLVAVTSYVHDWLFGTSE